MDAPDTNKQPVAEAEIEHVFELKGRGWVMMLKDGWTGKIPGVGKGVVVGDRGAEIYLGVEIADNISEKKYWVCVLVPIASKENFLPGDRVKFYPRPTLRDWL